MNPSIQTLAESLGITEPKNGTWTIKVGLPWGNKNILGR